MSRLEIQVEGTPNPNAAKFVLATGGFGSDSRTFFSAVDAASDPLAERLFEIQGVRALFMVENFITVTRSEDTAWDEILEEVLCAIREELE